VTQLPADLRGRHVGLRPVTPSDYEFLFNIEIVAPAAPRWRFRGLTPSFQQFVQLLHEDVLVTFIVLDLENGSPVGSVLAYSPDHRNGVASIAAIAAPEVYNSGRLIEGVCLLLDHVFRCWNLRKLYIQTFEFNLSQFGGLPRIVIEEGRLREYEFYAGRYWDKIFLSISRATWEGIRSLVLAPPTRQHSRALDFDSFVPTLAQDLDWALPPDLDAELARDCALDSLTLFGLFTILEDYTGVVIPSGIRNHAVTLGDAYNWYRSRFELD
jgi:RimJ/RimL family protein N-acetyltransferase